MKQSGNKVLVIVLIVIAVLAIVGGVFAYVCLATDMLKSEQELFAKYLTQNIEELTQTVNLNKVAELEDKLKQNKYEETITCLYTEDGENLPIGTTTIEIQKDPTSQKEYGIISLATQDPEETLKLEYMHDNDMYSLRFTNAVKQFLSIENSNLKEFATNLGADEETVDQIPDTIDFESLPLDKLKITEEEKNTELNRYVSALYNNIPKEKYTKSKDTVITVNGKTITTNAYILTLNMQDIKTIVIKLLETLKQDEIVLSKLQNINEMIQEYDSELYSEVFGSGTLKDSFAQAIQEAIDELTAGEIKEEKNIVITIYEQKGKTVRIKAEEGLEYITLDTAEVEGKKQIDLNHTKIDENNTQLSEGITIIKEHENNLIIKINTVEGEEQSSYEVEVNLIENGDNVKLNILLSNEEGKTDVTRDINFVQEINYKVTLDNSNNILLNELSTEQMSTIFTLVEDKINTEYIESLKMEHLAPVIAPITLVATPIATVAAPIIVTMGMDILNRGQEAIENTDLSKTEIEMFNAEFRVYEGEIVSSASVKALLTTVISHNQMEANNLTERYVIVTGDIELKSNDTIAPEIPSEISRYTVECEMNEEGLIYQIVITENNSILDVIEDAEEFTENDGNVGEENSSITSENVEYTPAELATIAPTDTATLAPDGEETIANTGEKVMGMLRTIGTIVIIVLLFL